MLTVFINSYFEDYKISTKESVLTVCCSPVTIFLSVTTPCSSSLLPMIAT